MLASRLVRAAGERAGGLAAALGPASAAAAVSFCAIFFGGGLTAATLAWIGALALLAAALLTGAALLGALPAPMLDGPAALFLGSLLGLAVWCGFSTVWSISPERTWVYTNRTVVYTAFALLGLVAGTRLPRARLAAGAAGLLALLAGFALLAKCVPALYDYGRVARLRSPLGYWNELALLCDAGVPLALWAAAYARRQRARTAGVVLLYALVLTLLLTYSRFGVALACLAAAAWVALDRRRVESLAALAVGGGAGAAVFGVALALPGITNDGEARSVRVHDGWIFALVVIAGAALVSLAALALARREVPPERRAGIERAAGLAALALALAGLAVSIAFAGSVWSEFTNPGSQLSNNVSHLASAKSNRWIWWQEAWHAFTRHPGGGTGAGSFELTNQMLHRAPVVVDEPHNTPLQFLSETGVIGFLLYLGVAGGALWGAWRARREPAGLALGLVVAAFFVHGVVDKDWNYVATCGPLLLLAGALLARRSATHARRPLLAAGAIAVALAAVYSLTAPWLAQRELAKGTPASFASAHSYDPLSVDALQGLAAFDDRPGHYRDADRLYRDAVALEPQNAETWYALGVFYFEHEAWQRAYAALNNAYTYDRFGTFARPCGLLDQARTKATGYTPPTLKCPGSKRPASP
jgi:O-antigen ligase/polysaccharide polymerase Wzy-like membrane protein